MNDLKNPKKKALIISYHFPPSGSTGAIRTMKFVKYLWQFGWEPVVLTCNNSFDFGAQKDLETLKEIPEGTKVFATFSFEPLNLTWKKGRGKSVNTAGSQSPERTAPGSRIIKYIKGFVLDILETPDRYQGWIPFALFRGLRLLNRYDVAVIFATAPPPSALIVGYLLSKFTGKPLVVDYRDPWTYSNWARKRFKLFGNINKRIERAILARARYIVSVSETRTRELQGFYRDIDSNKYIVIPNGYDICEAVPASPGTFDKFTFLHAGSLYSDDGVEDFIDVILEMVEEDLKYKQNIKTIFVGSRPNGFGFKKLEKMGVAEYIERLPRKECLDMMSKAHALLVFLKNDNLARGCIASKIFDYMMFRKPILGVVPEGETRDLIEKSKIGFTAGYGEKPRLKEVIRDLFSANGVKGVPSGFDELSIKRYERKKLTKDLAVVFERAAEAC